MDLVDEDVGDGGEVGIDLESSEDGAGGAEEDARPWGTSVFESYGISAGVARTFATLGGHAFRHADGRDPTGLRHDEIRVRTLVVQYHVVQHQLRDLRRLSCVCVCVCVCV